MVGGTGGLSLVALGFLGSLVAGLCTGLGALPIFLRTQWSEASQSIMLATAAGVMLGATFFSLLLPSIEIVAERSGSPLLGCLVAGGGILLGATGIWLLHGAVPHEHFVRGADGKIRVDLGRNWLFILAIALHNFPEGMSVGIAFGGDLEAGLPVAVGIGLQNMPEGLAVAAALISDGSTRWRAFWIACVTGLVEPIGGLFGAVSVSLVQGLLPWGLAFAAGAMLFVIFAEIVPETHRRGLERPASFGLVAGFVAMMLLETVLP